MARKIGLLGGSFNPAHHGHVAISKQIHTRLQLNEIWWLVTPQNPHKSTYIEDNLKKRIAFARDITQNHPFIKIHTDPAPTPHNTIDTIQILQRQHRNDYFLWLMGADNLVSFHRWHRWQDITQHIPLIIYDRPGYSYRALQSPSAHYLHHARTLDLHGRTLPTIAAPAWNYLRLKQYNISSTDIRNATTYEKMSSLAALK